MKILLIIYLLAFLPTLIFAQNFSNGFNFNLPHNDTTPSVFLPNFPKKTIGEADRVSVQGENFMVNGKPQRFWGVNLTTHACFPLKENASRQAMRMRKMGINLVRFHHMDNPWTDNAGTIFTRGQSTRTLNATSQDRLEFLISEFKKNNIYSNINLNVSRPFSVLDGVAGGDSPACMTLGELAYLSDKTKGLALLEKACDIGYFGNYACFGLGEVLNKAGNKEAAKAAYQKACDGGHAVGCFALKFGFDTKN